MILPASGYSQSAGPDLTILIDGTTSVDQVRLSDALGKLRETVPALVKTYARIKIGVFSDEGPFTKISAISIPPNVIVKDCSASNPVNKTVRLDLASMFPGIKDYQDSRNSKQCLTSNLAVEQKNKDSMTAAIQKIKATIPESIQPKTGCTGISGLLQFLLSSHPPDKSTFLMITDGEETCNKDDITGIKIPAGSKLILFIIPKTGPIEKEGPEALKRGEIWQTSIPNLTLQPYTDISETLMQHP